MTNFIPIYSKGKSSSIVFLISPSLLRWKRDVPFSWTQTTITLSLRWTQNIFSSIAGTLDCHLHYKKHIKTDADLREDLSHPKREQALHCGAFVNGIVTLSFYRTITFTFGHKLLLKLNP